MFCEPKHYRPSARNNQMTRPITAATKSRLEYAKQCMNMCVVYARYSATCSGSCGLLGSLADAAHHLTETAAHLLADEITRQREAVLCRQMRDQLSAG